MTIIEAKKVMIDIVTLQPMPSESELDIFTFTYMFAKINKVFILIV